MKSGFINSNTKVLQNSFQVDVNFGLGFSRSTNPKGLLKNLKSGERVLYHTKITDSCDKKVTKIKEKNS